MSTLTRKGFFKLAGAGAAATTLAGTAFVATRDQEEGKKLFAKRPDMNVVLIILDSLRKDHAGAHGNPWIQTPNLDALAKDSLRFTKAYPESMPTIPARRAIHTGIRTFPFDQYGAKEQNSALMHGWLPIPQGQRTLAGLFADHGMETLLVTDNYHQFKPEMNFHKGFKTFDFIRGQETDRHKPYWTVSKETMDRYLPVEEIRTRHCLANVADRRTEEDYFSPQVFTRASELLETLPQRQPFFMTIDSFDPHEPWDPPDKYVNLYYDGEYKGKEPIVAPYRDSSYLTDDELKRMRALYAGEVTMVDHWLGRFLDKLDELKLRDNTLLVLLSDHGHLHGEHDTTGKPHYAIWPELTDLVFYIRHPEGKKAGQTSDYYASTHDVAPTIFGALGLRRPREMEGTDLSVLLDDGSPDPRAYSTLGYHDYVWARDEDYALISRRNGERTKLYDLKAGPDQTEDISSRKPAIVRKMFDEYILEDAGGSLPDY
ncbi:sulfatase [soil metagenome]